MKKITLLLPVALLFLASCGGVDSELVASGKNHQCNIERVLELLKEDPENTDLQSELKEYEMYYNAIVTVDGKLDSDLADAIKKSLEEGCD